MNVSEFPRELVAALKEIVDDASWQLVGVAADLRRSKCRKLYAEDGEDLVLVYVKTRDAFYAMEAVCSHEGGPLEEGDLEDAGDKWVLVCPWHRFEFDVETGLNSIGLSQKVFQVKVVDGKVFVNSPELLSLSPFPDGRPKVTPDDAKSKARSMVLRMKGDEDFGAKESKTDSPPVVADLSTDVSTDASALESSFSLERWAVMILETPDPHEKARLTHLVARMWREGAVTLRCSDQEIVAPPETPRRPANLNSVRPEKIKRGKGGTLRSRIALLHSLCNIEQWAIDLSWDIIARFSTFSTTTLPSLPNSFFTDFIQVAVEEATHFALLDDRLHQLGSHFGALPVHDALWQSARETSDSFLARLAIVHMVHEARGLDVHPQMRRRFEAQGDTTSASTLDVIFRDEITHVEAGLKWFTFACRQFDPPLPPIETFHQMVRDYFKGYLKPPFNAEARETAGMAGEWYLPLVKRTGECETTASISRISA